LEPGELEDDPIGENLKWAIISGNKIASRADRFSKEQREIRRVPKKDVVNDKKGVIVKEFIRIDIRIGQNDDAGEDKKKRKIFAE